MFVEVVKVNVRSVIKILKKNVLIHAILEKIYKIFVLQKNKLLLKIQYKIVIIAANHVLIVIMVLAYLVHLKIHQILEVLVSVKKNFN